MLFKKKEKSSGAVDYIVVGLGNPGRQYENTRHNCGFNAIDALCDKYSLKMKKIRFKSLTDECRIGDRRCLIMKPSTYMNNSGEAVREAMSFYKVPPENIIIIFDDISLDVGRMRIRQKGSDGGHNGMKNIIYLCNSDQFPRIKIGVGAKPHPDYDLKDWVLSKFTQKELKIFEEINTDVVEAVELMVAGRTSDAMQKFN